MATYLKGQSPEITRQEGDDADITFIIPDIINTDGAILKFQVFRAYVPLPILEKQITMSGQQATIVLDKSDTKGKSGNHLYEIELTLSHGKVVTVAQNKFNITPELIK